MRGHRPPLGGFLLAIVLAACAPDEPPSPVAADLRGTDAESADAIRLRLAEAGQEPENASRRAALGLAYEAGGLLAAAADSYAQAAALEPSEPRWSYHLAHVRARRGELDEAVATLDTVLELAGDYVPAHLSRGAWLLDQGATGSAGRAFDDALRLHPGDRSARLGQARVALKGGEGELAASILESLILEQAHPYYHLLLGTAYRQLGQLERASVELARGRPGVPPPAWPDPWREELAAYSGHFARLVATAQQKLRQEQFDEVIALLTPALAEDPENRALHNGIVMAHAGAGRVDEELQALRAALEHHPDDYDFNLRASRAYRRRGNLEGALLHVNRAVELQPHRAEAYSLRGRYLMTLGRLDQALVDLDMASRYDASDPRTFLFAGMIESRYGNWSQAAQRFERAVRLDPSLFEAHIGLAGCRAELGRLQEAEAALDRAAQLQPDNPQVPGLRARIAELRAVR